MCLIDSLYWKLVYVAINDGSVSYGVYILEIGVCGCKCRECALRVCVLEIAVCGCKCTECAL